MQRNRFNRKLKLRRLLDRWPFSAIVLFCIIKVLQVVKKTGLKVEESGWRKFAGVFLRKEHGKFMLAAFKLKNYDWKIRPKNYDAAKEYFINRLADFLRKKTSCHWCFEYGVFRAKRKRLYFTDITEAVFNEKSELENLIPHFDSTRPTFTKLSEEVMEKTLHKIVKTFNSNEERKISDHKRAKIISKKLRRWAWRATGLSYTGRRELFHFIDRILASSFIQFEVLPKEKELLTEARLATPNMRKRRHPGYGLLNIVCRFTPNYKEVDMWVQYHHVPVDGMPMEEQLEELKVEWGTTGTIKFPKLNNVKPEIKYFGDKIYRGRLFLSFEKLLKVRKYVNTHYSEEMGGPATVSGMVIWGLAQRKMFRETKYVVTTDVEIESDILQDRNIGLIFIRPGDFINEHEKFNGFINFQKEFNQRIYSTKYGKSETNELLEIYAMVHPALIIAMNFFLRGAMKEIIGTAGLTVLKKTEVFISPLTDIQVNGFVSIGNLKVETEEGQSTAGAVSFCARKKQVREYIKGFNNLTKNYDEILKLDGIVK